MNDIDNPSPLARDLGMDLLRDIAEGFWIRYGDSTLSKFDPVTPTLPTQQMTYTLDPNPLQPESQEEPVNALVSVNGNDVEVDSQSTYSQSDFVCATLADLAKQNQVNQQ
jgi:hypothetical protein